MILHHFVSQLRVCAPSVSWPPANQPNWISSQTFLPTNQCPLFSLIINQAFPPFASDYKRKKLIFWFKKMHRYTNGSSPIHNFLFSKQLHPRVGNCYVITMLHYRSLWVETKQNSWVVTESNLRIRYTAGLSWRFWDFLLYLKFCFCIFLSTLFLYLWLSWPTSAPSCASARSVLHRSTRPSPSPSSLWSCALGVSAIRGHSALSLTGFWRGTQTD